LAGLLRSREREGEGGSEREGEAERERVGERERQRVWVTCWDGAELVVLA